MLNLPFSLELGCLNTAANAFSGARRMQFSGRVALPAPHAHPVPRSIGGFGGSSNFRIYIYIVYHNIYIYVCINSIL